jgi:hypothetical protein
MKTIKTNPTQMFNLLLLVIPSLVDAEKVKILADTLAAIDGCYEKVVAIVTHRHLAPTARLRIESLGRKVSDVMREGINRLAMLVDVEFETILKMIFDDVSDHENERVGLVLREALEIYESGNEVLEKITDSNFG